MDVVGIRPRQRATPPIGYIPEKKNTLRVSRQDDATAEQISTAESKHSVHHVPFAKLRYLAIRHPNPLLA